MDKHAQIICEMFGSLLLKRHSIHLVCEDSRSSRDLGSTQTDNEKVTSETRLHVLKEIWRQLCSVLPACKKYNDSLLLSVTFDVDGFGNDPHITGRDLVKVIRDKLEILVDRFAIYVLSCNYESVSSQGKDFISIVETDSQEFLDMDIGNYNYRDNDNDNDCGDDGHGQFVAAVAEEEEENTSASSTSRDNDTVIVVNLTQFSEKVWKEILLGNKSPYIPVILPHVGETLSSVFDSIL